MLRSFLFWVFLGFGSIAAAGQLIGVTPDELKTLQQEGALVIDIRTPEEWRKSGLIPGAEPLTYFDAQGGYNTDDWMRKLNELTGKQHGKVVLVCRSGNRSGLVGKMLTEQRGYDQVYHLEKGVKEWANQGKPLSPCTRC